MNNLKLLPLMAISALLLSCGTSQNNMKPELYGMKCEFVPDGDTAVIYGKHLQNATVLFPENMKAKIGKNSNDTMLTVVVPKGSIPGKLAVIANNDTVYSNFLFRDQRNTIIDFDQRLASWGGFEPLDEEGNPITAIMETPDSVTKIPSKLPEGCDGKYALLFGKYMHPWSMTQSMYIQYVANQLEGGRGNVSIAGPFSGYPLNQLALKFEVYIPATTPYTKVHTEIFFGPYDAPDKHGRDRSPIYFWEPFAKTGKYATSGWQTITIPLTQFTHGIHSSTEKFPTPIDLKKATNFSFVQFGDTVGTKEPLILMCVDNFRVVPISGD